MTNLYGITNIQVDTFYYIDSLNLFLREHNGNIIDIQAKLDNNGWFKYIVIYRDEVA